jgi:hypothetical protein
MQIADGSALTESWGILIYAKSSVSHPLLITGEVHKTGEAHRCPFNIGAIDTFIFKELMCCERETLALGCQTSVHSDYASHTHTDRSRRCSRLPMTCS